ncbi:hypothetical protein PG993_001340 [Apiospora rasikravindrae]|uniref:Uncharacterized protein n=1 Tax=Apiospora rasikravindrae TaxID=990691 RepID=A0ABR1UB42_9PEZI
MPPPALDLTHSTHAKMMVIPPRLNLRRAASYTGASTNEKIPLSSSSSRFSFNHLLFSPPPSPGLPALVPRPKKSPVAPRPSRVFRVFGWLLSVVAFLYIAKAVVKHFGEVPVVVDWALGAQEDFPLSTKEYADICAKCHEVATHVRELHGKSYPSQKAGLNYYYQDPYFLDVNEAEQRGLLPGTQDRTWRMSPRAQEGHLVGESKSTLVDQPVCGSSLTFVLETSDAGLGTTLMMLWMAYGLAQKERRAFFIDDSRWAYGEYTGIFRAPPVPHCQSPPRHEMLPCPRQARHLVVSAATAKETFGNSFANEYEVLQRKDQDRERPMFDLARTGYEALFHLNHDDHSYVTSRIIELRKKAKAPQGHKHDGTVVGIHVRHGDQHPFEYQYRGAYIPLNLYADKAREIIEDLHNTSAPNGGENVAAKQHSFTVIASDDPEVYDSEEFKHSPRAQEMIKLAAKAQTPQPEQDRSVMHKFVEETFGWEGGFFASMFWNLGRSGINSDSAAASMPVTPSAETTRLRSFIGRAYLMDLAILAHGSDALICTISATGCRLMAVMMGWEKAINHGDWVNIDGNYQWAGLTPLSLPLA